jgi:serine/threonine protein kinase
VSWKINHRSVCRLHDISRFEDLTYISMEYIRGETLRRTLDRLGALNVRKGAELIRQVCEGLREAHKQGIFHRDLKPENIMLDETGNVKLMDFGIARLTSITHTKSSSLLGTPAYMSPEQAGGKDIDARSDIYSLGLVMYEVFTGCAAFGGDTPIVIALKQINEKPRDPRTVDPLLPEALESAILRCIEKDPAKRFQSLDEVIAALALPLGESPIPPAPSPPINPFFSETAYVLRPKTARKLLLILEAGYLALYFATLFYLDNSANILLVYLNVPLYAGYGLFLFSATTGIAVRIYLTSAIGVNHPDTGKQFWRLFPALFVFDMLWAMSPLLLAPKIPPGLAFAFVVCLAYLPFSQKTLITNAYR